tara:strand:- start:144 stop:596 length:453 start_codon:yes stop_codon:yes gene_type:complete
MDINKEIENMNITTWADADDDVKEKMFEIIETSNYEDMVACNNLTCNYVITKDGSYTDEPLIELLEDEGVIEDASEFESADDDYDITGIKFYPTVVHINEVKDFEYNKDTGEITELGTTSTSYTLYHNEQCAKFSWRSYLLMKQRHSENK